MCYWFLIAGAIKNKFFSFFCFLPVVDCIFSFFLGIPLPHKNSFFLGSPYLTKTRLSTGNATCLYFKMFYTLIKKKSKLPAGAEKNTYFCTKIWMSYVCTRKLGGVGGNPFFVRPIHPFSGGSLWGWCVALGGPGWPCPALCPVPLGSPAGKPWEALGSPAGKPWPCALCPVPCPALCPVPCPALCPGWPWVALGGPVPCVLCSWAVVGFRVNGFCAMCMYI